MTVADLKKILDGLDTAHTGIVHSQLMVNHIGEDGFLSPRNRDLAREYERLCREFFGSEDTGVLAEMNRMVCDLLQGLKDESAAADTPKDLYREAVDEVLHIAGKTVRPFEASMAADMERKWRIVNDSEDNGVMYRVAAPFLLKAAGQVESCRYDEAAGNLYGLFGYMARVKSMRRDWFENMDRGGEMTDLVFLTDSAAIVYCHLRQKEDLPADLAEDMDMHLRLFDCKTGFFNHFNVSAYSDMMLGRDEQSENYSDLGSMEFWREFVRENT